MKSPTKFPVRPLLLCWVGLAFLTLGTPTSRAAQTTLIPAGVTWHYLDDGSDQGTMWKEPAFPENWASGPAELGYGDGEEATVVSYGPDFGNKYVTTYFRHTFNVPDASVYASLLLRILRDDGAIVYLNGTEVARQNMGPDPIDYQTYASAAVGGAEESTFFEVAVPVSTLVSGDNVMAVEIHQANATSSDISFAMELIASDSPEVIAVTRGPYLQQMSDTGVVIRWRTDLPTTSYVYLGSTAGNLSIAASDNTQTTEHEVALTGLSPDTQYYYGVGTADSILREGAGYLFYTAPVPGTAQPIRVWVIGDSGTADANAAAVRDAYYNDTGTRYTDVWLMLGDNAYNSGTDTEYQAAVFDMYPGMLQQTVLFPTIGNHDTGGSSSPPSSLPYYQMFTLPTQGESGGITSGTEDFYSFDYGNIHFVCLDSMTSSRAVGGAMESWLALDLEATTQMWTVAYWHHPPYTKGSHDSDTETALVEMRENILPTLEDYGVDLVLSGHSHSYERSFLIDGHYGTAGTFDAATMQIDGGDGDPNGNGAYMKPGPGPVSHAGAVYAVAGSSGKTSGGPLNHSVMTVNLNVLGSMILEVNGAQMDARFIDDTGTVRDNFTIIKQDSANSPPEVAWVSPSTTTGYAEYDSVFLEVIAIDPDLDGSVESVTFYDGATPIGVGASSDNTYFSTTYPSLPAGLRSLTARARDNLQAIGTSSPLEITVTPAAPTLLSADPISFDQIDLTWDDASASETGYRVERSSDGVTFNEVAVLAADKTTFSDVTVAPETTYNYRVLCEADGIFSESPVASATTPEQPLYADYLATGETTTSGDVTGDYQATHSDDNAAESLTESLTGNKKKTKSFLEHRWQFEVSSGAMTTLNANAWVTQSIDQESFWLEYSTDGSTFVPVIQIVGTDPDHWEVSDLPAGLNGTIWIRAVDADSSWSSPAADTLNVDMLFIRVASGAGSPPSAPTSLVAPAPSADQVQLAWTDNAIDETGFEVERSTDQNNWPVVGSTVIDVTQYDDTTVAPATTYYYRVRAFNGAGYSAYSNTVPVTTPNAPQVPELTATGYKIKGVQYVDLAWTGFSTTTSEVKILRDGIEIATVTNSGSYTDNLNVKGGGVTYFYQVQSIEDTQTTDIVPVAF